MKQIPITFMVSIALVVGGFLAPPTGVIDGSVLTAVGLLLMFDIVNKIPAFLQAVKDGKSIRVSKGDFSAEVNGGNE